jgi:ACS family hexuronate transporter-like MFS transporter
VAQTELPPREADPEFGPPATEKVATPWAWGVCWLMFASTALNYMDRQAMALVGTPIMREFKLDDAGLGWLFSAFFLTYAVFQVPAGYLADRWDVRRTYAGAVAWWSLAAVASSFSPSLGLLLGARALLGAGEAFNWPCALRVTSQILPPVDRSLGNGIFNSGAAVGAVVTPWIVTPLAQRYGWRTAFAVVGSLGFVWVAVWLTVLGSKRRPLPPNERPPTPSDQEPPRPPLSPVARYAFGALVVTALLIVILGSRFGFGLASVWWGLAWLMFGMIAVARVLPERLLRGADWSESLGTIVRLRRFWILLPGSLAINICWHFQVNWLPRFLGSDRGMTFLASGLWASVPFLAADVGNLGGGALSRSLAARGLTPTRARFVVLLLCAAMITCGVWVGLVRSNAVVLALLAVMAMGTAAFMANGFVYAQEVSARHTGLIVGILGGLANLCVAGFHPVAGMIKVATGGFGPVFVIVGLLPLVGVAMLAFWGDEPGA